MKRRLALCVAIGVFALSNTSWAGNCVLTVAVVPCPGKDASALLPYFGKKDAKIQKATPGFSDCADYAQKFSKIQPGDQLTSKKLTATWDGTPVEGGKLYADQVRCGG